MRNREPLSNTKVAISADTFFGLSDVRNGDNLRDMGEMMNTDRLDVEKDLINYDHFLSSADMPEMEFDLFQDLQLPSDSIFQDYIVSGIGEDSNSDGSQTSDLGSVDPYSASDSSPSPASTTSNGLRSPLFISTSPFDTPSLNPCHIPFSISVGIPESSPSSIASGTNFNQGFYHNPNTAISNVTNPNVVTMEHIRKPGRRRSASNDSPDVQAIKRQIRMIRNRESACLSRQKKKDYVAKLETEMKELEADNLRLRQENTLLRARLGQFVNGVAAKPSVSTVTELPLLSTSVTLQKEGKAKNGTKHVVGKIVLFTICTSLFLFFRAPTTSNTHHWRLVSNDSTAAALPMLSRTLDSPFQARSNSPNAKPKLWREPVRAEINGTSSTTTARQDWFPRPNISATANNSSLDRCPLLFNQTEALRVQNDLEGLFKVKPKKPRMTKPIVYHLSQLDFRQDIDESKGLTLYDEKQGKFSGLLEKLEMRQDTFYVFSLAVENQVLLSAKAHNESSRPKMSFLMPWRNDTLDGKEELMQIDCEVTRVVNLDRRSGRKERKRK